MRKKISTSVYITLEQDQSLRTLHDRTKVPIAELIRQGIDMVLDREEAIERDTGKKGGK